MWKYASYYAQIQDKDWVSWSFQGKPRYI